MAQRQWRSDDTDPWVYHFGDGHDGDLTVSGSVNYAGANAGCSGTASATTLTLDAASTFADGDLIVIIQQRGTGVGAWELNKVLSGGGTTTLTLAHALMNTYTDSGASQAQVVEMKEYNQVTITTGGTLNPPTSWDQNKGGFVAFFAKTQFAQNNGTFAINGVGYNGGAGSVGVSGGNSLGGFQGEGSAASNTTRSTAANGNGGGGGGANGGDIKTGGGGGSYGTAGTQGGAGQAGSTQGQPGSTVGDAGLVAAYFGGAGGGGSGRNNDNVGSPSTGGTGGKGGGLGFIFAKDISITGGALTANGAVGAAGAGGGTHAAGGGGGSGGGWLFKCITGAFGSTLVTATGGAGGDDEDNFGNVGGNGGNGRIHVDYSGSITGTTNPTIDSRLDGTINAGAGGGFFLLMV